MGDTRSTIELLRDLAAKTPVGRDCRAGYARADRLEALLAEWQAKKSCRMLNREHDAPFGMYLMNTPPSPGDATAKDGG